MNFDYLASLQDKPKRLVDVNEVISRTGNKRVKHYDDIKKGLMTAPVTRGPRFSRWPEYEVEAIVSARIAGAADPDIKELVATLHGLRRAPTHAQT